MQQSNEGSWSPVWEKIFQERKTWNKYPPEELVRFFALNFYDRNPRSSVQVLEIGCGPGAGGSKFVAREGFSYSGIDGSEKAIMSARDIFRQEGLSAEFRVGDIQRLPYPDNFFDCLFDIACLQHNSEVATQSALKEAIRVLKPGGLHFSLTAKSGSWGEGTGEKVDETSYRNVSIGPYAGMDTIRYATGSSLERLYSDFSKVEIEYSIRSVHGREHEIGHWMVCASKPNL